MDCAICYDAITKATGKIDLSCSHTFHIRCLTSWFKSQSENYLYQSCPCCRHEANEDEEVPMIEETEQIRFQDYMERVNTWYLSVQQQVISYRRLIHLSEEKIIASKVLINYYEKEVNRQRLRAEAAELCAEAAELRAEAAELRSKQLQAEKAKQVSKNKWADWAAAERMVIRL